MTWEVRDGDALERLRELPERTAHCVVTSPPYWGLRDYGHPGQIGLERSPAEYVARLTEVFEEVRRVLRDDGTFWLNIGDTYTSNNGAYYDSDPRVLGRSHQTRPSLPLGLKPKELVGVPWRLAFALQDAGWWLRAEVIWNKPNALPESVADRPTKSHEQLFLLTRADRYWYDSDAIREPFESGASDLAKIAERRERQVQHEDAELAHGAAANLGRQACVGDPDRGRNKRSVWTVPTQAYPGAHFAVFPPRLVEPCVMAGAPRDCCAECGRGWVRVVLQPISSAAMVEDPTAITGRAGFNRERPDEDCRQRRLLVPPEEIAIALRELGKNRLREVFGSQVDHWVRMDRGGWRCPDPNDLPKLLELGPLPEPVRASIAEAVQRLDKRPPDFRPDCLCHRDVPPQERRTCPGMVLDPFAGAGTTGVVATRLERDFLGLELNPEYAELSRQRIRDDGPLFNVGAERLAASG